MALEAHQNALVSRALYDHNLAIFLEPGMGKTAAMLTTLHDLNWPRTLVLAPALVADTVWEQEAKQWEHLQHAFIVRATGEPAQREYCVANRATDAVVMSYENLPWLLTTFGDPTKYFDCIVFDELSKMKHAGSGRFRRLRAHLHKFKYRYGLTGTPVGNHLMDIWGEMYAVAGEKPLGPTFTGFQHEHFLPVAWNQHVVTKWQVRSPQVETIIHQRIKPWAFTLKTPPGRLPEVRVNHIQVPLPAEVLAAMDEVKEELTTKLASGDDLYAYSAATAAMKVRQLAGGAVYVDEPTPLGEPKKPTKTVVVHGMKLAALENLVSELQGEPLLVFYWFKHEKERLLAHFKGAAHDIHEVGIIDKWNARKVEVLLAHPASAGHGLNLQHGGHNICWFTLPWSLELWKQGNGRAARTGQKHPWVNAHVLLAGDIDRTVLQILAGKAAVEDRLLAAMLD